MIYVLIAVTLSTVPGGQLAIQKDVPPTIAMQDFNSLKACQAAASAIRKELDVERNASLKLICAEKGK